jgi:hypothetical protein
MDDKECPQLGTEILVARARSRLLLRLHRARSSFCARLRGLSRQGKTHNAGTGHEARTDDTTTDPSGYAFDAPDLPACLLEPPEMALDRALSKIRRVQQ